MSLMLPNSLLVTIVAVLLGAVALYNGINGLKDVFPAWFDAHPMAARVFNAVGALLLALIVCVGGQHPQGDKSIFELIACVGTAVMTFLTAAGLHEASSKANAARLGASTGSVNVEVKEAEITPPKKGGR